MNEIDSSLTIPLTVQGLQDLIDEFGFGFQLIVATGTHFAQTLEENAVPQLADQQPTTQFETVTVTSAEEDGNGFVLTVKRGADVLDETVQYIFSAHNPDGVFISPQVVMDGQTYPLETIAEAPAATTTAPSTLGRVVKQINANPLLAIIALIAIIWAIIMTIKFFSRKSTSTI